METNLIENDIDIFLDKYTRFITKNIYISKYLYNNFMDSYNYLFEELEKNIFLYENTNKYKKVKKILDNKDKLLKHHNQNYLKDTLLKYNNYFDNIYSKEELDINKRKIILSEENNILVINNKNNIPLICMKIDYLIKIKKYKEEDILVLINDDDLYQDLQEELGSKFNYTKVQIYTTIEYGKKIIKDNYKLISTSDEFNIIVDYIKNILFKDKELFNKLYVSFSNKIYLNKDYKDYETFHDYHNYLYKRMYLSTNLSLKEYNKIEINKRKKYLRTLNDEIVNTKEEVDIANLLYLNSINYKYYKNDKVFYIYNDDTYNYIKYISIKDNNLNITNDKYIYLYSKYQDKSTYLEKLVYELIKRRYPMELLNEKDIYNKLKDTTENSYFVSIINDYFIPLISYYKNNLSFEGLNMDSRKKEQLTIVYNYYIEYLNNNRLIDKDDLILKINDSLNNKYNNYKYLINIFNKEIAVTKHKSMNIIKDNDNSINIFKDNIKLFYDYKSYLNNSKIIPILNCYIDYNEITNITNDYINSNLEVIDKNLKDKANKHISIYIYDDSNRLLISKNKSIISNKIVSKIKDKSKILLLGKNSYDIKDILIDNYFCKKDKNTIIYTKDNIVIDYKDLTTEIKNNYNNIILINLIPNKYDENILEKNYNYKIKLLLYIALTKSKNTVYILWPKSNMKLIKKLNIENLDINE